MKFNGIFNTLEEYAIASISTPDRNPIRSENNTLCVQNARATDKIVGTKVSSPNSLPICSIPNEDTFPLLSIETIMNNAVTAIIIIADFLRFILII